MVSLCHRAIVTYITENDLQGLQGYLENKRVIVDDKDDNGATALHYAATKGKIIFVRELLNHNADPNAEDNDNWSPLLCAAKEGYTDVCQELLDGGAQIEHRDMGGWTALMWASYKGHTDTVYKLLERGADVNAHGNYHISSLLWASGRGHTEIVKALLQHQAKVNVGDKYGTTALVWAARKGNAEIVDMLLKAGANVDTAGMYSWTPLLVATMGNHVEVVSLLLDYKPNVNASDKDGCTALAIACKEGYTEIATALLNVGPYINLQDRTGDTNLIHAVKGGHRSVVEALLKKYADVDIPGKERKTATYTAVEKGNIPILKVLLNSNPDLEIATKDGDTPLLRAVRSRNSEAVQLLLDKKAKVSVCDKRGDTPLHIAMRARSKTIVEILLRNPKNSQLLYRPNRNGETPYNIDMSHQKTILGQIFGARRLNTNEDNENLLGYDLYSSALADILSEPSLSMPITVGLYAKWGSGKSFLLNKLREEMKSFARQWFEPVVQFSWVLLAILFHVAIAIGVLVGLAMLSWVIGVIVTFALISLFCFVLLVLWYTSQRYTWDTPYNWSLSLTHKMNAVKVILQVMFCQPPGSQWSNDSSAAQPIRFYFTEQTRVGSTSAGENSVVQMIGSLYDSIESDYGAFSTRLYRAFRPKSVKSTSAWRWRRLCCLPNILIWEICFVCILVMIVVASIHFTQLGVPESQAIIHPMTAQIILGLCGGVLLVFIVANLYTIGQVFVALIFSQRRHLQRAIARLDTIKSEGFLQALRSEVNLMTEMVKCLDSFTQQQTRLVVIVDGLDSCEQDKVLLILDAVHVLFSDSNTPFIIILAIDPHVISKVAWEQAVEANSRRLLSESNIGGHDYLRNMVHLPFYLQNSGLRKVKVAQKTAMSNRKGQPDLRNYDGGNNEGGMVRSASSRRLSNEVSGLSDKLKIPGKRPSSRKLKLSDSIASSLGSNLNRAGGPHDLTKMLLTDDYFSDVNPRSMRRLMNVVYVTGRLLKAFQIDFNWYHLASWINITEQWPYRTSWIIYYHETADENIEESTSLKTLYDKVRSHIRISKDLEPLLELDGDERKMDIFLTFHKSSLLVSDLRVFMPFTINLDPYIKKVIKDDQQNMEEGSIMGGSFSISSRAQPSWDPWSVKKSRGKSSYRGEGSIPPSPAVFPGMNPWTQGTPQPSTSGWGRPSLFPPSTSQPPSSLLPPEVAEMKLSSLSVSGVSQLISKLPDIQQSYLSTYISVIQDNNINGRVLTTCDLDELKRVLRMTFGDWEIFRMAILTLRELEQSRSMNPENDSFARNVRFTSAPSTSSSSQQGKNETPSRDNNKVKGPSRSAIQSSSADKDRLAPKSASTMEKQVTLEEQMICGALQTLNEEAMEDVLEENPEPADQGSLLHFERTMSQTSCYSTAADETDVVLLQTSPLHPQWSAVACDRNYCSSAESSICDTPELGRRLLEETSPKDTTNLISSLAVSLGGSKRSALGLTPAVMVTPADQTNYRDSEDDESTPLVSDDPASSLSSPLTPVDGTLISPTSCGLTPSDYVRTSTTSSTDSLSLVLEGPQAFTEVNEKKRWRKVSRQDATEISDSRYSLWNDPETTV